MNTCFLKKVKYGEANQLNQYRFGFRLQREELKAEVFCETHDQFQKCYELVKRYCILTKFNKKYRILTKVKNSQIVNQEVPCAIIYKGYRLSDSEPFFIKVVDKFQLTESQSKVLLNEIQIQRHIDNPNTIKLVEIYEDDQNVFIVYEIFTGKSMLQKLREYVLFEEEYICDIIWKLLHALSEFEKRGIYHRDLKLDNIFFKTPHTFTDIVISNLQTADYHKRFAKENNKRIGTPGYMAPEMYTEKRFDSKVDVFSLGIIFYILIFGKTPWSASNEEELIEQNISCKIEFELSCLHRRVSLNAIDLMQKMLAKSPSARHSATQLLNHTWFVSEKTKVTKIKNKNFFKLASLSTIQEK